MSFAKKREQTTCMMSQLKTWQLTGQQTTNEQLKVRLSNVGASSDLLTAVAEVSPVVLKPRKTRHRDIQKAKRQLQKDDIKFAQLVSDVEILEMVETAINNSMCESVLNMNDIEKSYVCLLEVRWEFLPGSLPHKFILFVTIITICTIFCT